MKLRPDTATPIRETGYKPDKPSRAIVACHGRHGLLLHWVGHAIECERDAVGDSLEHLNLLGPDGVHVWEGVYVDDGPGDWPGTREYRLEGTFRPLTKEEWESLESGEDPWDEREWLTDEQKERDPGLATKLRAHFPRLSVHLYIAAQSPPLPPPQSGVSVLMLFENGSTMMTYAMPGEPMTWSHEPGPMLIGWVLVQEANPPPPPLPDSDDDDN